MTVLVLAILVLWVWGCLVFFGEHGTAISAIFLLIPVALLYTVIAICHITLDIAYTLSCLETGEDSEGFEP